MPLRPARLALALLIGALAGCQAKPPAALRDARMAFDRLHVRRAPAKTSGRFLPPEAARTAAAGPDAPDPAIRGVVLGTGGAGEVPLAGALVSTSDGRAGLTGPDGAFAIPGAWPPDGGLVASAEGYVASAAAGLPAGAPVTLHLRGRGPVIEGAAAAAADPFLATGRVVDPAGSPVAGALVVLEDAAGAFSAPATSGADGRFALVVFAPGRKVVAGTIVAVGQGEPAWLGLKEAVDAAAPVPAPAGEGEAEPAPEASAEPTPPEPEPGAIGTPAGYRAARTLAQVPEGEAPIDVGDVAVAAADATLAVDVDASAFPDAAPRTALELVAADGASLALPARADGYRVAALPGARYALRVEAEDVGRGTASAVHRVVAPAAGRVAVALLAPPATELDPALALNEALEWRAVPGARGYQVTLAGVGGGGFLWEGFTAAPAMPFSFQPFLPDGLYGLTITAWDAEGLAAREVLQAEGPRALRLPAEDVDWRRASRQLRVEL